MKTLALLCALVSLCFVLGGCSGGRLELASLDFRDIDPPPARVARIDFDRGYWWTDEGGRLWIALERERGVPFRPERLTWQLSLLLDGLPASRARNYGINDQSLRARLSLGPLESRWVSRAGIAAVYADSTDARVVQPAPGARLRGSFRLEAGHHSRRLLGEWSKPRRYLLLGNFTAVFDPERGRSIAAQTEEYGWDRSLPTSAPATRPATQPGSPP